MKSAKVTRQLLSLGVATLLGGFASTASAGLSEGLTLFNSYCAVCHGITGEGQAMGKSLVDDGAKGLADLELLEVIAEGRAGTGMAAWGGSFSEEEILDTANYIRAIQGKLGILLEPADPIADNPEAIAGRALFNGVGNCASCHTVGDAGGQVGPVLDGVFARLGDEGIRQAVASPSASFAEDYPVKEVTLNDGTVLRGVARNETDASVQIQSADGLRWRTYFKDRVQSVSDSAQSMMPDVYGRLNAQQKEQLLAYLNSL